MSQMGKNPQTFRSVVRRSLMYGKPTFQGANTWTAQCRSSAKNSKCSGHRRERTHIKRLHGPIHFSGNICRNIKKYQKKHDTERKGTIPSYLGMAMCSGCGTKAYSGVDSLKLTPCVHCSQVGRCSCPVRLPYNVPQL